MGKYPKQVFWSDEDEGYMPPSQICPAVRPGTSKPRIREARREQEAKCIPRTNLAKLKAELLAAIRAG